MGNSTGRPPSKEPTVSSRRSLRAGAGRSAGSGPTPTLDLGLWTLDFGLRPRQAGHRCPAAERNDPADQVDCGAGADRHGQRGQVRAPSSGSEPRPTQNRKSPRTMRPARIPIYGFQGESSYHQLASRDFVAHGFPLGGLSPCPRMQRFNASASALG
jgi:hypothetical protein